MRYFTMANDTRESQFERFVKYFFLTNPNATLNVIPFDENVELIQKYSKDYPIEVWDTFDFVDKIGATIFKDEEYRPGVPSFRYFRKLNAFFGHDDEFIFMDVNLIPLLDFKDFFKDMRPNKNSIYFGGRSVPSRSIKKKFENGLRIIDPRIKSGYNCGFIFSNGGVLKRNLCEALSKPRYRKAIGRAPEQGFLAIYLALFGLRHGTIMDLSSDVAPITTQPVTIEAGHIVPKNGPYSGRVKPAFKQTGTDLKEIPEIIEQYFKTAFNQDK